MRKNDGLFRIVILVLLFGVLPKLSSAQDSGLRPVSSKYAIKNATIIQGPGRTIQNGTIIIENGVIKAVGTNIRIPADAWIVDADSMFVYPGFISGMSNIGVEEPKDEDNKDDRKMTGTPTYKRAGITPGSSVREMLSTKEGVADYRKIGFTASHSVPHNGMIPGQGSLILLSGSSEGMLVKENISMFSQLSGAGGVYPNTVIGVMAKYRDVYRKAGEAKDYQSRYKANSNGMERPVSDATLEAMFPVVSKQMTVAFQAESIMDIMRVLTLKKDLGFNLMIGEVKQGWDAIASIKSSGAPVFLSLDLPEMKEEKKDEKKEDAEEGEEEEKKEEGEEEKEETAEDKEKASLEMRQKEMIMKHYTQASQFSNQGVKFGFSTLESKSKDFKSTMMKIIENGLSEEQALAALTTTPAEVLGVSSLMGTIDNGKMANLFVSDTAYFTKDSNVRFVFVDGVKYEYEVKKKKKKKSSGDEAVDASGDWNYTTETPQGSGKGVIKIEGKPDDYSGTISVSFNGSTNEITNLVVDGSNVTFSFTINMGEEVAVDISMDIEGDSFEGTLSVAAFGSFPMEGSREPK